MDLRITPPLSLHNCMKSSYFSLLNASQGMFEVERNVHDNVMLCMKQQFVFVVEERS